MAEQSDREADYWQKQIESAEGDNRYRRWLDVGDQFYQRYKLEDAGGYMNSGMTVNSRQNRMTFNLLWSNVQTQQPMLYSRLPEPYVSRRFNNQDPIARMAATIAQRATSTDLERDDFDDVASSAALDFLIVGRPCIRGVYEETTLNTRIPVRKEDREDGQPRYVTEAGDEIPKDIVERDGRQMFVLDPKNTDERAPLVYQFWKDFIIGPGRKWSDLQRRGWIAYRNFMTKAEVRRRFNDHAANNVQYSYSAYSLSSDERQANNKAGIGGAGEKLAEIYEVWSARDRTVYWVSKGYTKLLDKKPDYLELEGFFNTPRPLLATYSNDTFVPTPDYAEYYSQAQELDQITAKIEAIMEDVRAGGVFDGSVPGLGQALKNKTGGYFPIESWQKFASQAGMDGSVQEYQVLQKVQAVTALYEHRQRTKLDADEVGGMIDLFRGQQSQKDETLGQSQIRSAMGGLRVNKKQRDFQRYLRDCLRIKAEIVVTKFDPQRVLEMADVQALIAESPELSRLRLFAESEQGQQVLQTPEGAAAFTMQVGAATKKQSALIQSAMQLLRDDRMRTFKLDIETDSTVALDEATEKNQAIEFIDGLGNYLERIFASEAIKENPELKPLAGEMLMFMVRRFKIGRSLEQKIERTIQSIITAPPSPQQPDPLTLDVQRQAKKDETEAVQKEKQLRLDAYEAQTDRMEAQAKAVNAARDADRKDLETANKILESDQASEVVGNA